ncbi:MAG TPA: cupin domain-containing protein [Longimicrobium sp.]|jgi:quercetin dioxygenase-like cupin family protein
MDRARALLVICVIPVLGCTGGRTRAAATGETRSALAATTGAAPAAAEAGARSPRIVPLGPMSGDVEILYGHPDSAGPFVMRIRELPGTIVPPHTHPVDEHITVVQGTWYFATGERYDTTALRAMPAGAYAFAPRGTTMFAASPEGAVVQVHGTGPFHIHWQNGLRLLDEPGAGEVFHFRKGEQVATPRGTGRIRQGYASGAVIQYEIEGAGGALFMASQHQVRRTPDTRP